MIKNILLYNSGGGIGDSIQILPLVNTLKLELKNSNLYYITAHNNHFNSTLKDFKTEIKSLDLGIKYFGFRWWHILMTKKKFKDKNLEPFDLIIDLQTKIRNSLILKIIPHKYFVSSTFNFILSKPKIQLNKERKNSKFILKAINQSIGKNLELKDFDINKIDKKFFIESEKLLPKNNYVGLSITQGNVYRKKMWPMENIIKLCSILLKNKKTPVFFVEKNNIELKNRISNLIPQALFPEHQSNISSPALVTCLGKRLDFAISIDNGVMHMLSLGKIPMIVLFGPTSSEKFAPDYKNLIILDSKKIKNTSDISSISVEDVLHEAKQHSNFLY
jgi:ADP-heptose:LPS heptosyltransferase